jgi:hypothetical protein
MVACQTPFWQCFTIRLPDCIPLIRVDISILSQDLICEQIRCQRNKTFKLSNVSSLPISFSYFYVGQAFSKMVWETGAMVTVLILAWTTQGDALQIKCHSVAIIADFVAGFEEILEPLTSDGKAYGTLLSWQVITLSKAKVRHLVQFNMPASQVCKFCRILSDKPGRLCLELFASLASI